MSRRDTNADGAAGQFGSRLAALESMLIQFDERLSRIEEVLGPRLPSEVPADEYEDPELRELAELERLEELEQTRRGSLGRGSSNEHDDDKAPFQVVSIASRITESNESWTKHAWKLCLKNNSNNPLRLEGTIEFLDESGFVVQDESVYDMVLRPREEQIFRGYQLVDAAITDNIDSVSARVKLA